MRMSDDVGIMSLLDRTRGRAVEITALLSEFFLSGPSRRNSAPVKWLSLEQLIPPVHRDQWSPLAIRLG